ncbi:hypothetical protein Tco_0233347 [Tanacetum coccineum]
MEKQETMIQKSKCSSPGDSSDTKTEKQEMKENCSKTFQELKKVVLVLNPRVLFANENEFAFEVLFGEDYDSFAYKFYYNLARLENQMSRVEYHEGNSKTYLIELRKQYMLVRYLNAIEKEIDARAHHEEELARVYDSRVNEKMMQTHAGLVYMVKDKCDDGLVVKARSGTESEMKDGCSKSGNDTQAEGPDIRLSNDTKPLHKVQSTVVYNVNTNDRQHAEQPKFINEGKVDQDAEQYLENKTTESLNQTLVSENDKPSLLTNERDHLLKQIAFLESKLASQDIRSCQKEYHELRTSYNALKVQFDSLNRKRRETNASKSSKPKVSVSGKVHTGESSKPFSRRVSQFTTYSLQKDRKFSKNSQSFETFFPQKGFKTRASNKKNQSFETSLSCFTPVKQVWRPIKESQNLEASSSQKSFKPSTLKGNNQIFVTPNSRFTLVKQVWRPKQSHLKSFKYSKSEMLSMQNKNDFASTINKKGRFLNDAKTIFRNVSSNDNNKWKSSSSTIFITLHETPSFNNH